MIIIFDVDGTLIGGEEQDWPCFTEAIAGETEFRPEKEFWRSIQEFTGRAIVRAVAEKVGVNYSGDLEDGIRKQYLKNLRKACPYKGEVFFPNPGVVEMLNLLKTSPIFDVAIATGEFSEVSRFKLASAGINISGIPFATSSDAELRKDIIRLAAEKAGYDVSDAIYVGDGLWDMRACNQLEIPFIGTGKRIQRLREAGVEYLVDDLCPATLLPVIHSIINR
jgi:phosphoglycolate phosphatase-like HAD superfamily hydrolase